MSVPRGGREPFYFGSSTEPLFGCYHAAQAGPRRDCGVVLCYPMGEEYIRFHRAYRQLAVLLSKVGFPVLRFDFYGCGDSSGDFEQGHLRRWLSDVSAAISEMRRRSGLTKVCLVGLRLGGTLSATVGADCGDIDGMVLWDPVISGKAHIAEIAALHQRMVRYAHVKPKRRTPGDHPMEILGFPLTDSLIAEVEHIDLLAIQQKPANNMLLIQSHERVGQERLRQHLQSMDADVAYQYMPSPQIWMWVENVGRVVVPHQILQSVVSWMSEVYP